MFCVFVNLFVRTPFRRGGELVILFVPFLYPVSSHMDGFRSFPFSLFRPASHGRIFVVLRCGRKLSAEFLGGPLALAGGQKTRTDRARETGIGIAIARPPAPACGRLLGGGASG